MKNLHNTQNIGIKPITANGPKTTIHIRCAFSDGRGCVFFYVSVDTPAMCPRCFRKAIPYNGLPSTKKYVYVLPKPDVTGTVSAKIHVTTTRE